MLNYNYKIKSVYIIFYSTIGVPEKIIPFVDVYFCSFIWSYVKYQIQYRYGVYINIHYINEK